MSGIKELKSKFESPSPTGERNNRSIQTDKHNRLNNIESPFALDELASKTPQSSIVNPQLLQSKLDDEVAKHQQTQAKLKSTENELRELRRHHDKLSNKLKKLSLLFNDIKTVIDDEHISAPSSPLHVRSKLRPSKPPIEDTHANTLLDSSSPITTSSPQNSDDSTTVQVTTANPLSTSPPNLPTANPPTANPPLIDPPTIDPTTTNPPTPASNSPIPTPNPLTASPPALPATTLAVEPLTIVSPSLSPTLSISEPMIIPGIAAPPSLTEEPTPGGPSTNSPQPASPPLSFPSESPSLQRVSSSSKDKTGSPRTGRNYLTRLFSGGTPGAALSFGSKEEGKKFQDGWMFDRRDLIISQFLRAEKSYCSNLNLIVEVFLRPLRQEVLAVNPFISQSNVQQIFSHLEVILGSSKLLVEDIQSRVDNAARPVLLGDLFLKATDYFKLYTPYLSGYCQAFTVLNKCKADNSKFLTFIRERERQLETEIKDLGSLLVLPVMRISQYTLFLEELLETTPEDMPDSVPLQEALKKMKSVVEYVKEKTLEYESQSKVQQIQSMLTGKFQNLNVPHRRYIMEGALQEVSGNAPRDYYCFLFNDILVITRHKKKQFEFRSSIDLVHMEIHTPQDSDGRPIFTINPATTAAHHLLAPLLHSPISNPLSILGVTPASPKLGAVSATTK